MIDDRSYGRKAWDAFWCILGKNCPRCIGKYGKRHPTRIWT